MNPQNHWGRRNNTRKTRDSLGSGVRKRVVSALSHAGRSSPLPCSKPLKRLNRAIGDVIDFEASLQEARNKNAMDVPMFNRSGKKSDSEKGVFWKRDLFRKVPISREFREFRDSRGSRDSLDCGKERRIRPFSGDSREFRDSRDSRDSSGEKTPFLMTPFSGPEEKRAQRLTFWVRRPPGGVGVLHAKGWWPKTSCSPSKVCLPWDSKRGIWDVPGVLPGCPGPLGVFQSLCLKSSCAFFGPQIFQKYLSDDFSCIVTSFPRAKFV